MRSEYPEKRLAISSVQAYIKEHTNPPVFFISSALVLAFLIFGVAAPSVLGEVADAVNAWITNYFGWFYILTATFFLLFVVLIAVSRFGKIRLGPDDAKPEYQTTAWFAMLFTAGMGIGLVYFGVYEPLNHFTGPPTGSAGTAAAADRAMNYTFFHWGLHPWAIYIVLGLAMAYFAFRRKLPLRPASALYPLIGDRIYGWIGNLIDILAVFGTLFGLATSLGLGTKQINSGLNTLFGLPNTVGMNILIIFAIEVIAIGSVMLGVGKGIRRLSLGNMWLAAIAMVFVFFAGPKLFMLSGLSDWLGYYIQHLPETSFTVFDPNVPAGATAAQAADMTRAADWQASWTLFYWGWWISWSPFVGMFIARISYGRTIRQFILGALLAPTGASFVWFAVFGGAGLFYDRFRNAGIADAEPANAIFILLQQYNIGTILASFVSIIVVIVVALFFATSSDSGSLVVDMLTNGGDPHPIKWQRLFWAVVEGLVAAVLLLAGSGSLTALQTASIATGLPFAVVLIAIAIGLTRGLSHERLPGMGAPRGYGAEEEKAERLKLNSETPIKIEVADGSIPDPEASGSPAALGDQEYEPEYAQDDGDGSNGHSTEPGEGEEVTTGQSATRN